MMGLRWSLVGSRAGCVRHCPAARTGSGLTGRARAGCAPHTQQRISGAGDFWGPAAAATTATGVAGHPSTVILHLQAGSPCSQLSLYPGISPSSGHQLFVPPFLLPGRVAEPCPGNQPSASFVWPFRAGLSHSCDTLICATVLWLKARLPLTPFFPSALIHPPSARRPRPCTPRAVGHTVAPLSRAVPIAICSPVLSRAAFTAQQPRK